MMSDPADVTTWIDCRGQGRDCGRDDCATCTVIRDHYERRDGGTTASTADRHDAGLQRLRELHVAEREAQQSWLARVTAERDEALKDLADAQAMAEVFRRKLDEDTDQRDELRAQRAAVLNLADQWATSEDMLWPSRTRRLLYDALGATDG
jgi:hypothetical protein